MHDDERHWFIDALDADGGIAFASVRRAGVDTSEDPFDEYPVIIAAPHFNPVPVSSRAISLGAISQGAQSGVFGEGGEVAFESLDQVIDFVRNTYIGGGANGATPAPETTPRPPEEPDRGEGGVRDDSPDLRGPSDDIVNWLTFEADGSGSGEQASAASERIDKLSGGGRRLVIHAAESIALSLMRQEPSLHESLEKKAHWLTEIDHFQRMLGCIGLSEDDLHTAILHQYAVAYRYRRYRYDVYGVQHDVFRKLAEVKLPADVRLVAGLGEEASIADLLAYCCATSTMLPNSPNATGLVLFAAVCIVMSSRTPDIDMVGDFHSEIFRITFRDAMHWLSQQFRSNLPEELRDMVMGDQRVSEFNRKKPWTTNLSGGNTAV